MKNSGSIHTELYIQTAYRKKDLGKTPEISCSYSTSPGMLHWILPISQAMQRCTWYPHLPYHLLSINIKCSAFIFLLFHPISWLYLLKSFYTLSHDIGITRIFLEHGHISCKVHLPNYTPYVCSSLSVN